MPSPDNSAKKDDLVVFWLISDSSCSECGEEVGKGCFLRLENHNPLCLPCADLDHLVFLPSGDAALTRRAGKHSRLRAVVVRFSRARKRYERQGILVGEEALARAEQECLENAEARARTRERAASYREKADDRHVAAFADKIQGLFPGCPPEECRGIAEHACRRSSGRIGRSASARELSPSSVELAVRAHIRHAHTPYDELLSKGMDRQTCRSEVADLVEDVVSSWLMIPNHGP